MHDNTTKAARSLTGDEDVLEGRTKKSNALQAISNTSKYRCGFVDYGRSKTLMNETMGGNTAVTTTEYVWSGDALVATVDQQSPSGVATGMAQTSYMHPDHLVSTNVITNASGTVISTKDYYQYGSVRISSGSASLKRGYIGEFSDDGGLSYLNARYYNPTFGQFLSQDPSYLAVGNPRLLKQITGLDQQQFLSDPQLANSISYARDNPITNRDPKGNTAGLALAPFVPVMEFEAISGPIGWGALALCTTKLL